MGGYRLGIATVSAVLALAVPTVQPSPPATRAFVACPVATVPSVKPRPSAPSLPVRDRSRPAIGGENLGTAGLVVPAGAPRLPSNLTARSWLVADLDTGDVLGACGPHEYGVPASVQKLLLAATLLSKLDPARLVQVTREDLNFERGSSAVGLLLGGRYTVQTLWLGLLLNSGNDAANVLARVGGGAAGVAGTMAALNAEARRLGAYDTHAVTPSGLDAPGQFTSAYDLALIARACFAREDFRRYAATPRAQVPAQPPQDPRGFQIQNDNPLLSGYRGAMGGKTGYTDLARHTYVGAAERDGRRLVVTLLGAEARPVRAWQQAAGLLDWGFALPAGTPVGRLVAPGEAEQALASPPPTTEHTNEPARAAPAPGRALDGWPPPAAIVVGGVAAAFTGVPLLVLLVTRLRRASRTAGRSRRHARSNHSRS